MKTELPELVGAGECVVRRGWRHPPECLDWHKLILSTRGLFRLRAQGQSFELWPHCFLIVPAGACWEGENETREGDCFRWIMFHSAAIKSLQFGRCDQTVLLDSLFEALLQRLKEEQFPAHGRQLLAAAILSELDYQSRPAGASTEKKGLREHDIAHQAILLMKESLTHPLDLTGLAWQLQLNPEYLGASSRLPQAKRRSAIISVCESKPPKIG